MEHHTIVASPYLQDSTDFQPSSSTSAHFDLPLTETSYDPYTFSPGYPQDHAHFPHTPSYNGSPFSQYSDLPPFSNTDAPDALNLFQEDNPSGITIHEEYDPDDYDLPHGSSLLTFDEPFMSGDSSHPQVAITPPGYDHSSPTAQDHPSPASSNGLDDDQSRDSSNSSYMHPNSPPLNDFAANFESLHFDSSPSWSNARLPTGERSSPPLQKPQSPPQLVIPDVATSPATTVHDEPPIINAPDGDGVPTGPQLHIVPATPISGGGITVQNVPFLQQGTSRNLGPPSWEQQTNLVPQSSNQPLSRQNQPQTSYFGSNPSSPGMGFANRSLPSDISRSPEASRQQQSTYLVPQVPLARSRSLSDTSLRPPLWDTVMPNNVSTVNMRDVLPAPGSASPSPSLPPAPLPRMPSSAGPHQSTFNTNLPPTNRLPHHFSYGPPNTSFSPHPQMSSNDFLSPDIGATSLRRAKSDGMRTPGFGHRQVRSEDYRVSTSLAATTAGSSSLYPPPGPSSQEFIRNISSRQFLHPTQAVPSIASRGHHRRSSSGSRERPMGWTSGPNSARASPYPSPHASPRPGYGALPNADMGMGHTGHQTMGVDPHMMGGIMDQGVDVVLAGTGEVMTVAKQNVTTPSTADASQKRRKQPANFKCPIPGCGSTFTRHFNLKGHLRSHAEQKPYMCKWPGCQKGFARQHDCKRHEQLHLNIRPYPCEGCKKNFARMDALNRHLRSEGGAECRKIQKEMRPGEDDVAEIESTMHASEPSLKQDPDDNWGLNSGIVM